MTTSSTHRRFALKICARFLTTLCLLAFAGVAQAHPVPDTDYDIQIPGIELRPGVEVDIHVKVYVNEDFPCRGRTYFAVHGFAHTAATWGPLAEALFDNNPTRPVVCRVAAIDLPGRGGSSLPVGLTYSELVLEDHVSAILGTLDALRHEGVRARRIVAHSQGGLLVQMVQQRLIDQGTNLRHRFQIRAAVLLASVGSTEIPWFFVESGAAGQLIAQFLTTDPTLGTIISIPDAVFPGLFFTDLMGVPVAGTPTPAEVTTFGYNAPEPLFATLNLVGEAPLARPQIDAGIFAPGRRTRLFVATYEQDILIRPEENALLYEHLTGDASWRRLAVIDTPESVHDLHLSDPSGLLAEVMGTIRF